MRRWSYALGGLIAWTVHFGGVYAFASLAAQSAANDTVRWQAAAVTLGLVCAGACGLLLAVAARHLRRRGNGTAVLMDQFAAMGAGVGLIAIAWQTASAAIV